MDIQAHEVGGLLFQVRPGVAPVTEGSRLLAAISEVRPEERLLDLGTGCGVQAVLAAKRGARVIATDVLPQCLDCARANAERHGVADRIDFRLGSLFEPVADETFDVIFAFPPQMPSLTESSPETPLDVAGEAQRQGREALDGVLLGAAQYLRPRGRLLLGQFAFHGVERTLAQLRERGLEARVVAEQTARSRHGAQRIDVLQSLGLTEGVELRDGEVWLTRVVIAARGACESW